MIRLINGLAGQDLSRRDAGREPEADSVCTAQRRAMESNVSVYQELCGQELCGAARHSAVAQLTPLPDNVAGPSGAGFGHSTRLDVVLERA